MFATENLKIPGKELMHCKSILW